MFLRPIELDNEHRPILCEVSFLADGIRVLCSNRPVARIWPSDINALSYLTPSIPTTPIINGAYVCETHAKMFNDKLNAATVEVRVKPNEPAKS